MAKTTKPEVKAKGKTPSKEKAKKENLTLTVTEKANGEVSAEVKPKEYIEINNPEETIIEPVKEEVSEEVDHVEHIDFKEEITHKFTLIDGSLGKVEYSDGTSELMSEHDYKNLDIKPKNPIESNPLVKSKEEKDLEDHYASLGQIDYYIKHVKK